MTAYSFAKGQVKMKKMTRDIVLSFSLGIITNVVSQQLLNGPLSWILAFTVFLISVLILTILPEGAVSSWARKFVAGTRSLVPDFSKEPSAFSRVFDFNGEQVRLVFTCRSRIDKAPCPDYDLAEGPRLKHVIYPHVPVDEFLTMQLMLQWYKAQIRGERHQELLGRFACSYPFDNLEESLSENESWNRANLPDFAYDNLIIIGENSCSNLMLSQLKHILNFYPRFSKIYPYEPGLSANSESKIALPKIKIDLMFLPNNENTIDTGEMLRLNTDFDQKSSNAVAMICYAPNPFNVQKRILILFGCHRVGQYLLEDWLQSPESALVFRRLLKGLKSRTITSPVLGQMVLSSPFKSRLSEEFDFTNIHIGSNSARKLPIFPFMVRTKRVASDGFEIDMKAVQPGPMVDLSLIIEISKHDPQLSSAIDNFFYEKLPFLHGQYWESKVRDIGLHVTLYEFATHESHEKLVEGIEQFNRFEEVLNENGMPFSPQLTLIGFEVFPSSIVLYADLPVNFLDTIQEKFGDLLPRSSYFNRMRIPFPVHCTVIRFSKGFNKEEQRQLRNFADSHRKHLFGEFPVHTLSLLLTRKQPYQDVERQSDIKLAAQSER